MEKKPMTAPQSTTTAAEGSLTRDVLYAARYYLGNRWTLLALAVLAVAIGLSFGGWGWLVAAGLLPILLSTLPCLIMCGFGVCMMCRGEKKQSSVAHDAADGTTSAAALGVTGVNKSSAAGASCCHDTAAEDQPTAAKQVQSKERSNSNA